MTNTNDTTTTFDRGNSDTVEVRYDEFDSFSVVTTKTPRIVTNHFLQEDAGNLVTAHVHDAVRVELNDSLYGDEIRVTTANGSTFTLNTYSVNNGDGTRGAIEVTDNRK